MTTGDPICPDCEMMLPCRCSGNSRARFQIELERANAKRSHRFWNPPDDAPPASAIDPPHYKELDPEPIDVIDAWDLGFYEAQVLKYLARAGRKGGEEKRLEDLMKARFYLERRISQLERKR